MALKTLSQPVCLLCEARAIIQASRFACPSWQQSRAASQLQKRRPQRMTLSPSVAKPPSRKSDTRKSDDRVAGPFAAMNRTSVGRHFEEAQRRKEDERRRRKGKAMIADDLNDRRVSRSPKARDKRQDRDPAEMKALKMQRALSSIPYNHRANVKKRISDVESFDDFSLLPALRKAIPEEGLKGLEDITPTPIQKLAIPMLLDTQPNRHVKEKGMKQFLLAAETGSGKTLAYLVPVLDAVKRADLEERQAKEKEVETAQERKKTNIYELDPPPLSNQIDENAGRPKAIILLPTSELVEQVGGVFKAFSHAVKLRVSLISASYTATVIRNRLFGPQGIDIIISTPHLLSSIAESDPNILSRVTHLVADEADSLFDRGFSPLTTSIVDRASPSLKQLILCSATIPQSLDRYLQRRFPDIRRLATPNLHAIPRRVQLSVIDIDKDPYRGNRDLACADTIWQIGRAASEPENELQTADMKRIIVFVNEREKANELTSYLLTKGVDAVALNRDTVEHRRNEILSSFTSPSATSMENTESAQDEARMADTAQNKSPRILSNTKVIVMTDIGSRGIDTVAVRNVILYDVPHTTIDYIHRLGRVGRMGRRGRGFVLVGKDDRKDVVREVREGMFRGQALI